MTATPAFCLLAASALVATTPLVNAQDGAGPPDTGAAVAAPTGAATLGLAQALYALGVTNGDATTVLAAAKLAALVRLTTAEPALLDPALLVLADEDGAFRNTAVPAATAEFPAPLVTNGARRAVAKAQFPVTASGKDGAAVGPVLADAMFAKAEELAAGDDGLVDVITDARTESGQERTGAAFGWTSRLPAGGTDVWQVPFKGSDPAEVVVVGDGGSNLDVVVSDDSGNSLCNDVGWSDSLSCTFTPDVDGYHYVTVQNVGGAGNSYLLITN